MSKKILVPYSEGAEGSVGRSFIVPLCRGGVGQFINLENLSPVTHAVVVYVGMEVTPESVFKRIINAGCEIAPSVEWQMRVIKDYLNRVSTLKVGDVLEIGIDAEDGMKLSRLPRAKGSSKLPG